MDEKFKTNHLGLQGLFPYPESVDCTIYINGKKLLRLILKELKIALQSGNSVGKIRFEKQKSSQQNAESLDILSGDPTGNRTRVSGVRVRF